MENRFAISLVAPEFPHGGHYFKNVHLQLFHANELPESVYRKELEPMELDWTDPYLQSCVKDTFSLDETIALASYFLREFPLTEFRCIPVIGYTENEVGCDAVAVGGNVDHHTFTEYDDPPPVPVYGHYRVELEQLIRPIPQDEVEEPVML